MPRGVARPALAARIAATLPRWTHEPAAQLLWRRWTFPDLRVAQAFGHFVLTLAAVRGIYPRLCVESGVVLISLPLTGEGDQAAERGYELARAIEGLLTCLP